MLSLFRYLIFFLWFYGFMSSVIFTSVAFGQSFETEPDESSMKLSLDDYYEKIISQLNAKISSSNGSLVEDQLQLLNKVFEVLRVIIKNDIDPVTNEYLLEQAAAVIPEDTKLETAKTEKSIKALASDPKLIVDHFVERYSAYLTEQNNLDKSRTYAILRAMMKRIDPLGEYYHFENDELQTNRTIYTNIQMVKSDDKILVVNVFPDSDAQIAGVQVGDQIVEIGQKPIDGLTLETIVC